MRILGASDATFCMCVDPHDSCFPSPTSCQVAGVCPPGLICTANTLVLPANVSDVGSMIALAMNVIGRAPVRA